MTQARLVVFLVVAGLLLFIGARSFYIVRETEQAILIQFGEIRSVAEKPGLYLKLPEPIQRVVYIEKRLLPLQTDELEVADSQQRRFVVDAVARWRISDPTKFYQTVAGSLTAAEARLQPILGAAIRRIVGQRPFNDVLADHRAEVMRQIEDSAAPQMKSLGIDLVDVRIRRADQPEDISARTYERMRSDRQREATDLRARGQQEARRIRAEAENQSVVTRADAQRQADIRRGEGDAQRNRIFAEAYGKDPEFFAFYRSMRAYETALNPRDTTYLLAPNSEFLRYFNSQTGAGRTGP